MIATKQVDLRANLKKYFDIAFSGEPVIVSRKQNKNVVVISESEYNELQRAKRNAEYLKRLNESMAQANEGNTITLSLDELQAMESDDWKPSQKMLDFMEKIKNDFTFTANGFKDYLYWQMQDKKTLKKINSLLEDIKRNGALNGIGKPEKLKNRPEYSRRIDDANRLVYVIDELQNIKIIACRGHYDE